jgi:hypothetical protein
MLSCHDFFRILIVFLEFKALSPQLQKPLQWSVNPSCFSIDLAKESDFEVTAVDIDRSSLKSLEKRNLPIQTRQVNLSKAETVRELVRPLVFLSILCYHLKPVQIYL